MCEPVMTTRINKKKEHNSAGENKALLGLCFCMIVLYLRFNLCRMVQVCSSNSQNHTVPFSVSSQILTQLSCLVEVIDTLFAINKVIYDIVVFSWELIHRYMQTILMIFYLS